MHVLVLLPACTHAVCLQLSRQFGCQSQNEYSKNDVKKAEGLLDKLKVRGRIVANKDRHLVKRSPCASPGCQNSHLQCKHLTFSILVAALLDPAACASANVRADSHSTAGAEPRKYVPAGGCACTWPFQHAPHVSHCRHGHAASSSMHCCAYYWPCCRRCVRACRVLQLAHKGRVDHGALLHTAQVILC